MTRRLKPGEHASSGRGAHVGIGEGVGEPDAVFLRRYYTCVGKKCEVTARCCDTILTTSYVKVVPEK